MKSVASVISSISFALLLCSSAAGFSPTFCPIISPTIGIGYAVGSPLSSQLTNSRTQCSTNCFTFARSSGAVCRYFNYNSSSTNCTLFSNQPTRIVFDAISATVAYHVRCRFLNISQVVYPTHFYSTDATKMCDKTT